MACYHPNVIWRSKVELNPKTGRSRTEFLGAYRESFGFPLYSGDTDEFLLVPCGQCIGCRLDSSRNWADRMTLELDHSHDAVFMTLTYNDFNLPRGKYIDVDENGELISDKMSYSLYTKDLQDFWKLLRYYFPLNKIRYYAAGEYGDSTARPHYHAVVFGLSLDDIDRLDKLRGGKGLVLFKKNKWNQCLYYSDFISSVWSNGYVVIGSVSWQTCAYVARYVTKKLKGQERFVYDDLGIVPPGSYMSRRPGIAGYFAREHPDALTESKIYIEDLYGVQSHNKITMPKYVFQALETVNPVLYNEIKLQRSQMAQDAMLSQLHNTDLCFDDYLHTKEVNHSKVLNDLCRPFTGNLKMKGGVLVEA